MSNPKILDFSAPEEEAITIVFPDGVTTCELPTAEELSMSTLQFMAANGEEWQKLFEKGSMNGQERKRFDHLNESLVRALCEGVPESQIKSLSNRQKAKVILGFITASPNLVEAAMELQSKMDRK